MNLPLPSADDLVGIVFLILVITTIVGGLIACNAERLVRAVAGLVVCFVGVAGLYYFLNSPFVAMMQVLIYVGAVAITISFAIMLAAPEEKKKHGPASPLAGPLGIITATFLFAGFALLGIKTQWTVHEKVNMGSVETIGKQLLTDYSMVFELISIVLLIAIIGSLVIARRGRNN
jgi:NADH:ubiquinone oxidoreductase subunit 6 (subunit J)